MKNKRNMIYSMLNYIALCFMIFVVLPVTAYYFNQDSLIWEGGLWCFQGIIISVIGLPFIWLFSKYFPKCSKTIDVTIIAITLYLFIRNFFWPVSFGLLDGTEIVNFSWLSDGSFWISLSLLLILFIGLFYKRHLMNNLTYIGTLVALGFVIIVSVFFLQNDRKSSVKDFNQFSSTKNIIIISLDAIQGDFLYDVFKDNPQLKSVFDGFTFYTDVTSYAPFTNFSIYSTVLGQYFPAGKSADKIEENIFNKKNTIISHARENGYAIDIFFSGRNEESVNRANTVLSSENQSMSAFEIAILKVLPKSISWKIIAYYKNIHNVDIIKSDKEGLGGIDFFAFQKLYHDAFLIKKPVFKLHHYLFTHYPLRFNEQCVYNPNTVQNYTSAKAEIVCSVHEFDKFLAKLKALNIYDNSFIILTSDHGFEFYLEPTEKNGHSYLGGLLGKDNRWSASRYWPILLLKKPHERGPLQFNNQPVSLVDIAPTIYQELGNQYCNTAKCDGYPLDNNIDKSRVRKVILFDADESKIGERWDNTLFVTRDVVGKAHSGVVNAFVNLSMPESFICPKEILFNKKFLGLFLGLGEPESWGTWSVNKSVMLFFTMDDAQCSFHQIKLKLNSYYLPHKTQVLLNGVHIGEIIHDASDLGVKEFTLSYPPEAMKKINKLEFIIGNPKSPHSVDEKNNDMRELGLGFIAMSFL